MGGAYTAARGVRDEEQAKEIEAEGELGKTDGALLGHSG